MNYRCIKWAWDDDEVVKDTLHLGYESKDWSLFHGVWSQVVIPLQQRLRQNDNTLNKKTAFGVRSLFLFSNAYDNTLN